MATVMTHAHRACSLLASLASLAVISAAACGGGGDDDPGGGGDPGSGPIAPPDGAEDYLFPSEAHSGFDGTHTFLVPFSTNLTDVTWSVADPDIASVAPAAAPEEYAEFGETWALVTTKKAGTTKIIAAAGGKQVEATLTVAPYDGAQVTAGEMRYVNPDDASGAQRNACASCHALANGVDHSPLALAFYDDESILAAITTGTYPDGYVLRGVNHMWNLTDAERPGIVPYLRSLQPRGF